MPNRASAVNTDSQLFGIVLANSPPPPVLEEEFLEIEDTGGGGGIGDVLLLQIDKSDVTTVEDLSDDDEGCFDSTEAKMSALSRYNEVNDAAAD